MTVDTVFFRRCVAALERALEEIGRNKRTDTILHALYIAGAVKLFELTLKQSGVLLRKQLASYFASDREAYVLHFRDLFRYATRHDLMSCEQVERWLDYQKCGNDPTLSEGDKIADGVLALLPGFIGDARSLADMIETTDDKG